MYIKNVQVKSKHTVSIKSNLLSTWDFKFQLPKALNKDTVPQRNW